MEAVGIRAIRAEGGFISQDERNLDDSSESSSHQRVTKNTVDHSADHKMLGMGRHGKAGEKNDNSGDQVPLGLTVSLTAHPDPLARPSRFDRASRTRHAENAEGEANGETGADLRDEIAAAR